MKCFCIIVIIIVYVHGKTFWQAADDYFHDYFANDWRSLFIVNDGPYQAKPDPLFPKLKLFIFARRNLSNAKILIERIDPAHLENYISELNQQPTVLYVYGFLDKSLKFDLIGDFESTTATLILASYAFSIGLNILYEKLGIISFIIFRNPPPKNYVNFIVMDWSEYNTNYLVSLSSMPVIANVIGDQLYELSQNPYNSLNLTNWHFIGHSLGAHIVGMIARRIKARAGEIIIPRVTGLDSAGPIIEFPLIRDLYPRLTKDCGTVH